MFLTNAIDSFIRKERLSELLRGGMTMPKVSVVIPTRNRPEAILCCLDALAKQGFPSRDFEVIVVDDGSEPPSMLEVDRWSSRFDLKLIHQENTGPGGARNRGVAEATGEFLAFTDDDCLPSPDWLGDIVAALERQPEALVGGSTFNGLKGHLFSEVSQLILAFVYEHFNRDSADAYFFTSNNMGCRKVDFLEVGRFDASFQIASEDRDFCDRWRSSDRTLVWLKDTWVEHRHAQNLFGFMRLHFRYGQGAWNLQRAKHRDRPRKMLRESGFHLALPLMIVRSLRKMPMIRAIGVLAGLFIWQGAYASGFLYAFASSRFSGR
ncbi:MAG: glycosyltransferase family 2 protein [Pirellulaceae bacterium]